MFNRTVWFSLQVTLITLLTCTSKPIPEKLEVKSTLKVVAAPAAKVDWKIKWDKTLESAKKEGKLVIAGSAAPQVEKALAQAFENKFRIPVESLSMPGSQMSQKILTEQRAGLFLFDIHRGGIIRFYTDFKPAGALEPLDKFLILPDVLDPKLWYRGELPWVKGDEEHIFFPFIASPSSYDIVINKTLVKPEEINSFSDLLEPKWKGKIIFRDPSDVGTAAAWFNQVLKSEKYGVEYMRQLSKQEITVTRDTRFIMDKLSRGAYAIAMGPIADEVITYTEAGAPITVINTGELSRISHSSGGIGIFRNAPHPNVATVFVNWLLSREGQIVFSRAIRLQSARVDVPTDHLSAQDIRVQGRDYMIETMQDILELRKNQDLAREIFKIK